MYRISVLTFLIAILPLSVSFATPPPNILPRGDEVKLSFTESLARHVSGIVRKDQGPALEDGEMIDSSVIWIPTYYGYHSFIGVLDNYLLHHTSITSMRTWRMEERKYWAIHLSGKDVSIKIVYDSLDSLLLLSLTPGY